MRNNSQDETIKRNYIPEYRFLIEDYELVKAKEHPLFRLAKEFYAFHDTDARAFLKRYNRYKQSDKAEDLLPRKRGPKWKTRRPLPYIEHKVRELRERGMNRYEIVHVLKPKLGASAPSPSGVYNIIKRQGLNRLKPAMKASKRRIIKEKAGELGHVDAHHLSKCLIEGESKKRYWGCVIDSCTRIARAEVVEDLKSLTVMFATLRCLNIIADRYTRPYRPQTNGKVERIWRTLEDDLLYETTFDSPEHLKDKLLQYLYY